MKKISILSLMFGLLFVACTKDFEEINTNPNDPTTVPSGLQIADVVISAANTINSTFVGGDMGACWSQQWSKVQYNDEERYLPREGVIESTWINYYEDVISGAKTIQNTAISEENESMQGVALVLQAYGFSVLTDMYGDIPFSQALKASEGIFSPAYDSQQAVYDGILAMLDQANTLLATGNGAINASSDLIYGGDVSKWQKFANSLKFRCLMRISGAKDVSADLNALMSRPMFASINDEAKLPYLSAAPNANPIYEIIVFGTRNEWKVCEVMVNTLQDNGDPRLPIYVAKNGNGEYRGKPAGIFNVPSQEYSYDNVSPIGSFFLNPTLPGYFVSYAELEFLKAEAAHRGLISGNAQTYYEQAVTAAMNQVGISAGISAYLQSSFAAWSEANALQLIGTQKWIALYGQGVEAWTEWRRTGIPALLPAQDASIEVIPKRYTYPSIEQSVNSDNVANAVTAAGGSNSLANPVWWMN